MDERGILYLGKMPLPFPAMFLPQFQDIRKVEGKNMTNQVNTAVCQQKKWPREK